MTGPIVLEGPDGSGKSTLADAILMAVPGHRIRNGPPPPESTRESLLALYTSQLVPGAIVDRSWPSEMIYGPRLRGRSLLGWRDGLALKDALTSAGGRVILCLPPFATCLAAWGNRPELLLDEGALRAVWSSYYAWADIAALVPFDWTVLGATERLVAELR